MVLMLLNYQHICWIISIVMFDGKFVLENQHSCGEISAYRIRPKTPPTTPRAFIWYINFGVPKRKFEIEIMKSNQIFYSQLLNDLEIYEVPKINVFIFSIFQNYGGTWHIKRRGAWEFLICLLYVAFNLETCFTQATFIKSKLFMCDFMYHSGQ